MGGELFVIATITQPFLSNLLAVIIVIVGKSSSLQCDQVSVVSLYHVVADGKYLDPWLSHTGLSTYTVQCRVT